MTAEHEGLAEALAELADDFASNVDWSNGRSNYGDNEAWESAARQVRELAASDALADLLAARDRRVRAVAWDEGYGQAGYDMGPYQYRETPNPYCADRIEAER